MSRIKRGEVPARLRGVQRRFDQWRQTHQARSRLPGSLWTSAVKMAHRYGIHRTAKSLRLDYYSLKKRLASAAATPIDRKAPTAAAGVGKGSAVATFLELSPLEQAGMGECTLELEDTEGATMRIHLKGCNVPDLAALARSFWGVRS